jgi:hypothetical protein
VRVVLLPFVGGQGGMGEGLADAAVIGGLMLAGLVKWGLKRGWRRVAAPRGRHRT